MIFELMQPNVAVEIFSSYAKLLKKIFMSDTTTEKQTRLSTTEAFLTRYDKYAIEVKQDVIKELTARLNAHKQRLIDEAQATIDKLKG